MHQCLSADPLRISGVTTLILILFRCRSPQPRTPAAAQLQNAGASMMLPQRVCLMRRKRDCGADAARG